MSLAAAGVVMALRVAGSGPVEMPGIRLAGSEAPASSVTSRTLSLPPHTDAPAPSPAPAEERPLLVRGTAVPTRIRVDDADPFATIELQPGAERHGRVLWPALLPEWCPPDVLGSNARNGAAQTVWCSYSEELRAFVVTMDPGTCHLEIVWGDCGHVIERARSIPVFARKTTKLEPALDVGRLLERLRVQVVGEAGQPIGGARLELRAGAQPFVTRADGRVELVLCRQPGAHPLVVWAAGKRPRELNGIGDGQTITLEDGILVALELAPGDPLGDGPTDGPIRATLRHSGAFAGEVPVVTFDPSGRAEVSLPVLGKYAVHVLLPGARAAGEPQEIEVADQVGQVLRLARR